MLGMRPGGSCEERNRWSRREFSSPAPNSSSDHVHCRLLTSEKPEEAEGLGHSSGVRRFDGEETNAKLHKGLLEKWRERPLLEV